MDRFTLDHVAVAVASLDEAARLFANLFGAEPGPRERIESQGVDIAFLRNGAVSLELLEPLDPDTPVGRFLARRGPGLHHIALRVSDLDAELLRLTAAGVRLAQAEPRVGAHGRRVAFIHPASAGGVLVELVEAEPASERSR